MCGRYSAILGPGDFDEHGFAVTEAAWLAFFEGFTPRYNVAPTQSMPVAFTSDDIVSAEWGLRPSWKKAGPPLFNSRGETVTTKFRKPFEAGRCVVFADGFFEWQKTGGAKVPYRFTRADGKPFAFAGVSESTGDVLRFSILTTEPNELVRPVHNRMPVILEKSAQHAWLTGSGEAALAVVASLPSALMSKTQVSTAVNSWKNDSPEIVVPVA